MAEASSSSKQPLTGGDHHRQHVRGPHRNKFDNMPVDSKAFQAFDYQVRLQKRINIIVINVSCLE